MLSSKGLTNFGEVTANSGLPAASIKLSIGENTKDVDTPIRFKKRSFMSFLKPHTHPFGLDLKPKYNCFTQIIG